MKNIKDSPYASFVWFLGVCEDTVDPLKANRIRVRCLGYHTKDLIQVPVEALPWAPVLSSSVAMSGHMILPGDWVIGFFLDGIEACQPVVFGSYVSIPNERPVATSGFSDPSGVYPKKLGVPQNSSLARGELPGSPLEWKNSTLAPDEPSSPAAPEYPYNHVIETDGFNIIELDDTKGKERIHIFHKSGTFYEIHPDGKLVVRSVADAYEAVLGNKTLYVSGDLQVKAAGDMTLSCSGDLRLEAGGDVSIAAGGSFDVGAGGSGSVIASGTLSLNGSKVLQGEGSNKAGSPSEVPSSESSRYME